MIVPNAKGDRPTNFDCRLDTGFCELSCICEIVCMTIHHCNLALEYSHRPYIAALPVPSPVTFNLTYLLAGKPYLYQNSATREGRGLEILQAARKRPRSWRLSLDLATCKIQQELTSLAKTNSSQGFISLRQNLSLVCF